jgi:hypothetical protein
MTERGLSDQFISSLKLKSLQSLLKRSTASSTTSKNLPFLKSTLEVPGSTRENFSLSPSYKTPSKPGTIIQRRGSSAASANPVERTFKFTSNLIAKKPNVDSDSSTDRPKEFDLVSANKSLRRRASSEAESTNTKNNPEAEIEGFFEPVKENNGFEREIERIKSPTPVIPPVETDDDEEEKFRISQVSQLLEKEKRERKKFEELYNSEKIQKSRLEKIIEELKGEKDVMIKEKNTDLIALKMQIAALKGKNTELQQRLLKKAETNGEFSVNKLARQQTKFDKPPLEEMDRAQLISEISEASKEHERISNKLLQQADELYEKNME